MPPVSLSPTLYRCGIARELVRVWQAFRQAFYEEDIDALGPMSVPVIYCSECRFNTTETHHLEPGGQYVEDAYYISIAEFVSGDIEVISEYLGDKIMTPSFRVINDENNKVLFTRKLSGDILSRPVQCYSILFSIIEPQQEFERLQGIFTFVRTADGFKFCAYGTVP